MQNHQRFEDLIPLALRSVPYIFQSHVCKAYVALENLHAQRSEWPDSVWDYCIKIIREDEPKVDGLIAEELLALDDFVDSTSGRDFGPDWILGRGLMPLGYWAMRKKHEEIGFEALFQTYLNHGLANPVHLGHEISVFAGLWRFCEDVLSRHDSRLEVDLFLQRFTEYVMVTFAGRNETVVELTETDEVPSEAALLEEALRNPGFFGHNVLACVWAQRLKPKMTGEQYQVALRNLARLVRPAADIQVAPCEDDWSEAELDERFVSFFLDGPTNIHQITLADALLWVWKSHPEYRRLCAGNVLCFTQGARPG
ncbi:MAG: hypothetical protein VYE15_04815 [Myxococcota bacterium]|nr:hypothetical protein [Myxococcota bacterium]